MHDDQDVEDHVPLAGGHVDPPRGPKKRSTDYIRPALGLVAGVILVFVGQALFSSPKPSNNNVSPPPVKLACPVCPPKEVQIQESKGTGMTPATISALGICEPTTGVITARWLSNKAGTRLVWPDGPESTAAIEDWFNNVELSTTSLFHAVLSVKQARRMAALKEGKPFLNEVVIDIGNHQGFFMGAASQLGFKAIGFDMQPLCVKLARCTMLLNGFHQNEIYHRYVTTKLESTTVNPNTCSGGTNPNSNPTDAVTVEPIHAGNELLARDPNIQIAYIKIDVEGYEPIVLDTLEPLFAGDHGTDILMTEITPKNYPNYGLLFDAAVERFRRLIEVHGFKYIYKLPEGTPLDPCSPPADWLIPDFAAFKTWLQTDQFARDRFVNAAFLKHAMQTYCPRN